jgi:regulator of RNase E activity RraA
MTGPVPLDPSYVMVGEAVTLRYVPAREDIDTNEALGSPDHPSATSSSGWARRGARVDARGDVRAGSIGEILVARMKSLGAAGFVTDGAVRDAAGIRAVGLPGYAKAAHASANITIHHAADFNRVIGCGGIMVRPAT